MSETDPLTLLRQYNMGKKEIIENDDEIIFGKYHWPKNIPTRFFKKGSAKNGSPKEYYTLECLLNFLNHVGLPHPEYVMQAEAARISAVRRPDRKDILRYLSGETSSSPILDPSAPSIPPKEKRDLDDSNDVTTESVSKKLKQEDTREPEVEQHTDKTQKDSEGTAENISEKTVPANSTVSTQFESPENLDQQSETTESEKKEITV